MNVTASNRVERDKLRWRCRRGMKELDLLLGRYVEDRFDMAPEPERAAFAVLLDTQDPLIYAYCLGQVPVPAHLADVIERITGRRPAGRPPAGPRPGRQPPAGQGPAGQGPSGQPSAGRPSG